MATKRGIEEIRQWVRTNLKDGDIRFMAEKWYDHMAGSNKFEATHDVYALYEVISKKERRNYECLK